MFPVAAPAGRVPQRIDSLHTKKGLSFTQIDEELRDIRRVHSQGQEEDLRMALSRTIGRVEELTSMLKDAYKAQTDMQTELTLAKSNLQLALANNEMLEDALKREGGAGHAKDIGWRRLGAKEQKERERAADSRRHSMESIASVDGTSSSSAAVTPSSPMPSAPVPATAESRFFKFRFGNVPSSSPAPSPRLPGTPNPNGAFQASHLTSASLPSLVPGRDKDKELEDLTDLLDRERKAHKDAKASKAALEAELESLSQALFEEANKMVAAERMKFSELEDELQEARAEKEALRSALRLMENQRIDADSRASSRMTSPEPSFHRLPHSSVSVAAIHAHKRSSSSAIAIKSLPGTAPSSPRSAMHISDVLDLDTAVEQVSLSDRGEGGISRGHVPPPLSLTDDTSPASPTPPAVMSRANPPPQSAPAAPAPADKPILDESASTGITSAPPVPAASSTSPSSPDLSSSSPTPSPSQFVPAKQAAPISYLDSEESPWADVRSQTPVSAAF